MKIQKALTTPFWSESQGGVVIPVLNIIIPRKGPATDMDSWDNAMANAAANNMKLPSLQEMQYIFAYHRRINRLLKEHGGDTIASGQYWTRDSSSDHFADEFIFWDRMCAMVHNPKSHKFHFRPVIAFNYIYEKPQEIYK